MMTVERVHGDEHLSGGLEERRRVLRHASSLNRADVIKKVVASQQSTIVSGPDSSSSSPPSSQGAEEVDRDVLDYEDEDGLTALHYAVKKSSLDAIRVMLRLGVDVTARGSDTSAFPHLTAYEVALNNGCKGDPEEVKQVFLTEAVQAIARGDTERLEAFLQAGLQATSGYGSDGGNGDRGTSLAEWAEQLGHADMVPALSTGASRGDSSAGDDGEEEALFVAGTGEARRQGEGDDESVSKANREMDDGRGQVAREGGDDDDAAMFVQELREAILNLTTECEKLEVVLSPRGTMGVMRRARSARQDVMMAEREVETAKALCDRWRLEEDAAVAENARLQVAVVRTQEAVRLHRTASNVNPTGANLETRGGPEPSPSGAPDEAGDDSDGIPATDSTAGGVVTTRHHDDKMKDEENATSTLVGDTAVLVDGGARASGSLEVGVGRDRQSERAASTNTDGRDGASRPDSGSSGVMEASRREEAAALSSHLQAIATDLEDELSMMRALERGDGAGRIFHRIRALREEAEAAEEEARQTFAVSRYLEARVIVQAEQGDELRNQVGKLNRYLLQPPGPPARDATGYRSRENSDSSHWESRAPHEGEDIDSLAAALERDYQGPVLDAFLGGEEEGGTPIKHYAGDGVSPGLDPDIDQDFDYGRLEDGRDPSASNHSVMSSSAPDSGVSADEGDSSAHASVQRETPAAIIPPTSAKVVSARTPAPLFLEDLDDDDEGIRGRDTDGGGVFAELPASARMAIPGAVARPSATAATMADTEDSTGTASATEGESTVGGKRDGRARALLSAPGVDAASGVRGWRRQRGRRTGDRDGTGQKGSDTKEVSVVQDVLSVLFGWDVSARGKRDGGSGGKAARQGGVRPEERSGVMYA